MAKPIEVTVDTLALDRMGERLANLDGGVFTEVATEAVNQVAQRTYDLARDSITKGVNLSEAYVTSRMELQLAKASNRPRAAIIARGSARKDYTVLGHYGEKQLTAPAKNAKGDAIRGIPPGQKAAGISVEVTPGSRKTVRPGKNDTFTLIRGGKLVLDSEGNPLIVRRIGSRKKLKALYGPSVYQVFRTATNYILNDVEIDLSETVASQAEAALLKALQ